MGNYQLEYQYMTEQNNKYFNFEVKRVRTTDLWIGPFIKNQAAARNDPDWQVPRAILVTWKEGERA